MTPEERRPALRIVDDTAVSTRPVVILVNVGTPDAPTTPAVRRYLKEFLSDPRVLDIPALVRFFLLRLVILPFRSPKSAKLYQAIWTNEGSPLLVHTRALAEKLRARLPDAEVLIGMRYGNPSLAAAIDEVKKRGATRVVLVPLFPQYASASTGTGLAEAYRLLGDLPRVPDVTVVPPFFDDDRFLASVASTFLESTNGKAFDHVLFSYHAIPLRQVQKVHAVCAGKDACCATLGDHNASCYRAQSVATTRALVERLGLAPGSFTTSFQSRLGRAEWIGPATDETIRALAKQGVKRLAILCPSFVSDCLETVEEIGVQAREIFQEHGGEELIVVPCINARDDAADAFGELVRRALPAKERAHGAA